MTFLLWTFLIAGYENATAYSLINNMFRPVFHRCTWISMKHNIDKSLQFQNHIDIYWLKSHTIYGVWESDDLLYVCFLYVCVHLRSTGRHFNSSTRNMQQHIALTITWMVFEFDYQLHKRYRSEWNSLAVGRITCHFELATCWWKMVNCKVGFFCIVWA